MKRVKSEYRRKQQAKDATAKSLQRTKARFVGLGPAKPPSGITSDPPVARRWERKPKIAPTSDQIPASAAADDFMHAQIAPAYNKGASNICRMISGAIYRCKAQEGY